MDRPVSVAQSPLKTKIIRARGRIIFYENTVAHGGNVNKQCRIKSSRWPSEQQLDTDSCRGAVPMQPVMSDCTIWAIGNFQSEIYDTHMIMQGAPCTIP